jgi:hypothetical protein
MALEAVIGLQLQLLSKKREFTMSRIGHAQCPRSQNIPPAKKRLIRKQNQANGQYRLQRAYKLGTLTHY